MYGKNEKQQCLDLNTAAKSQLSKPVSSFNKQGQSIKNEKTTAPSLKENEHKGDKENLDQNVQQQKAKTLFPKKPLSDRIPIKGLKLKPNQPEREIENILEFDKKPTTMIKGNHENELIQLREEIKTLQAENRFYCENYKAFERHVNELKLEVKEKDEFIEQLNSENEHFRETLESQRNPSSNLLEDIQEENHDLNQQLASTQMQNRKLREIIHDLEIKVSKKEEPVVPPVKDFNQEESLKIIQNLETKCRILLDHIEKKENERKEAQNTVSELVKEKEEMLEEIDYFKDMAKMSKKHAEKAIADVEFYKNLLKNKN